MPGQAESLIQKYRERIPLLRQAAEKLQDQVKDVLDGLDHLDRIAFRVKGETSFVTKAMGDASYRHPLAEIEDQIAGRVIVFFDPDIAAVTERILNSFTAVEQSARRPKADAEFGYETHHLILVIPPNAKPKDWESLQDAPTTFELQVRTIFMHAWAEPQHNLGYKSKEELPKEAARVLGWIAASAWGADQGYLRVLELIRRGRERQ